MTMTFKFFKHRTKQEFTQEPQEATVPYWRLYRFATVSDWLSICIAIAIIIIAGGCHPYFCVLFGEISEDFISFIKNSKRMNLTITEKEKLANEFYSNISGYSMTCGTLGLIVLFGNYVSAVLLSYSSLNQIFRMKQKFLEKALHQDISWYDINQSGNFATALSENFTKIEEGIGEKFGSFLHFQSIFSTSLLWSFMAGWKLALVSMASFPILTISIAAILWVSAYFSREEVKFGAEAGSIAEEALSGVRTVVAFDGQAEEAKMYEKHLVKVKRCNILRHVFNGISIGSQWLSVYVSTSFCMYYGIMFALAEKDFPPEKRTYTPAIVVALILNTILASWNFSVASVFLEVFGSACGAATQIFKIMDSEPYIQCNMNRGTKLECLKGRIVFDRVNFTYPSRPEIQVLKNFSLRIEAGRIIALVGNSGSGKSTSIQLLQRFYDINSGAITIDGRDIKSLELSWLRSKLGVVEQEPALFATTISENIRYGKFSATQEDIERVAKQLKIHKFIKSLPNGYETVIGERGTHFSGGQKQRLAIARALIREPSILLLDEATSALDTASELDIQKVFHSIKWPCTIIIAAHRLSTVKNAHKIYVLSEGRIIEEGKYEELIENKGPFYNLVKSQVAKCEEHFMDCRETVDMIRRRKPNNSDSCSSRCTPVKHLPEENLTPGNIMGLLCIRLRIKWFWFLTGCISSVLIGTITPLFSILFGDSVGSFTLEDKKSLLESIASVTEAYCLLGIVVGLSYTMQIVAFGISGENMALQLRTKMFSVMLKQEIGWFDREENRVGNLCSKLSNEAAALKVATGMSLGMNIVALSSFILSTVLAVYLEWRLALVFFSLLPFVILIVFFEQNVMQGLSGLKAEKQEISTGIAVEAIRSIRTVVYLGCQQLFLTRYVDELIPFIVSSKKKCHLTAIITGFGKSILYFSYAMGLRYAAKIVTEEHIDYATICKVAELAIIGFWSLGLIFAFTPDVHAGIEASRRILALLGRKPAVKNIINPSTRQWDVGDIEYTETYFCYPTRPNVFILKGLDLKVFAGKTVALVGPSGSGKSTIIQLLERFYDVTGGEICIDNVDIGIMDLSYLRSNFGIVSQEPTLFSRSIAENIAYGLNNGKIRMSQIIEAANNANIHNFIVTLKEGYDSSVGAKGVQLSGGQKQRIAIARALLRNPRVLLLDEATSALDNENEKIVQSALDKAKNGRTCIMIAHRLTTVQDADVICVLEDGQIVEMGKHQDLLKQGGLYCQMYKQSSNIQ